MLQCAEDVVNVCDRDGVPGMRPEMTRQTRDDCFV